MFKTVSLKTGWSWSDIGTDWCPSVPCCDHWPWDLLSGHFTAGIIVKLLLFCLLLPRELQWGKKRVKLKDIIVNSFLVSRSRRSRDSRSHNVCMFVCLYVCMSQTLIRFKSMNSSVNSFPEWQKLLDIDESD